jgi:hypothetical protein
MVTTYRSYCAALLRLIIYWNLPTMDCSKDALMLADKFSSSNQCTCHANLLSAWPNNNTRLGLFFVFVRWLPSCFVLVEQLQSQFVLPKVDIYPPWSSHQAAVAVAVRPPIKSTRSSIRREGRFKGAFGSLHLRNHSWNNWKSRFCGV